jgi:Cu-Zn family superoxide dismutase
MKSSLYAALASVLVAGVAAAQEPASHQARFVDEHGQANGQATLTAVTGGVLIELEVAGMPAGEWVAFHVHETGTCEHGGDFQSAGGHFNPGSKEHGYLSEGGPHAGDMPNQSVGADGTLRAQVFNGAVTLDKGEAGIVGRALMIHAKPDDYRSQPAGDAGARLACAVIE